MRSSLFAMISPGLAVQIPMRGNEVLLAMWSRSTQAMLFQIPMRGNEAGSNELGAVARTCFKSP